MAADVRFAHVETGKEGSPDDFTAARDFMRALEGDMKLGGLLHRGKPASLNDTYPDSASLFATGLGAAPYPSGTNLQIDNIGGLIHQYTSGAAPDGATPKLLSYYVDPLELSTLLSAGDATNPRIDLIEIMLDVEDETNSADFMDSDGFVDTTSTSVTRKRVRLTKNVVAGTPAATPSLPSTTSGYVPYAYVWVPATHSGVFTSLHLSDLRYPVGYSRVFVPAWAMSPIIDLSKWAISTDSGAPRKSIGASELLVARCPVNDMGVRVLAAHVHADANADLAIQSVAYPTYAATTMQLQASSINIFPAGSGTMTATRPRAWWAQGAGHARYDTYGQTDVNGIQLQITSLGAGTRVYGVSFELVGTI